MAKDINKKEEKQEILKPVNAGKARLIAALMVVIAIFFGTRSSLMSMRNEALEYFTDGDPAKSLDYGIVYDLEQRVVHAKNVVTIAKRYISSSDAFIKNIETDCEHIEKATEPNKLYKYNEELEKDVYALIDYIDGMKIDLNETDAEYIVEAYVNFESDNQRIGHSEYNNKAKEFNAILSTFPTSITSKLAFVKPLSLFAY